VTMAPSSAVAEDVYTRLARACRRFSGIHVRNAGYLSPDAEVLLATGMNQLFSVTSPDGAAAVQLGRLADTLLAEGVGSKQVRSVNSVAAGLAPR
jgi:hypothetical protein